MNPEETLAFCRKLEMILIIFFSFDDVLEKSLM